ncbi:hypothetical protein K491DRAFT_712110 [Lophiostoma macrostomum CBS 122681]|uniref:Uncharacterized protein n=1 Tax=Lophiostoma macrostomum CBS 122681 TaxID=1314788 RepID=A0A6A6TJ69_9PLEO|nr:hypothetical protein K491DRAFT_712110 [Lophiostoma macrostomum CBS 122681]
MRVRALADRSTDKLGATHENELQREYKALVEGPQVPLMSCPVNWESIQQRAEDNHAILASLKSRDEDGIARHNIVGVHIPHGVSDSGSTTEPDTPTRQFLAESEEAKEQSLRKLRVVKQRLKQHREKKASSLAAPIATGGDGIAPERMSKFKEGLTTALGLPASSSVQVHVMATPVATTSSRLRRKEPPHLDLRGTNYNGSLELKANGTKDHGSAKSDGERQQEAAGKIPTSNNAGFNLDRLIANITSALNTVEKPQHARAHNKEKPEKKKPVEKKPEEKKPEDIKASACSSHGGGSALQQEENGENTPKAQTTNVTSRCRTCQANAYSSVFEQAERELEYKHRHVFIGTASLDDFLEILEMTSDYKTYKDRVASAFTILAATEQETVRKEALRGGWELVSRIDATSHNSDYVARAQIKLGSITLAKFLDLMQFDEEEMIGAINVIEAFSVACFLDGNAGNGTGSKAKAFRRWNVEQQLEA